jgi:hypothetical protein
VRNVKAAGCDVTLRHGHREEVHLEEIAVDRPAPVLKAYLKRAPGARPNLPVHWFASDDEFMRHLAQVIRNGLGDRAGTCLDPRTQVVTGKTVCLVSCQRSPEPVFLRWKGTEEHPDGDFYVRSGPGTVKPGPESANEYIRTRFPLASMRE